MVRFACLIVLLQLSSTPPVPATSSIEGWVVHAGTREPLENARVDLVPTEPANVPPLLRPVGPVSRTDAEGRFAFKNIVAGDYRLMFSSSGFVQQEYGQRSFVGRGVPIHLAAGLSMKDVIAELTPAGAVSGKLVDEDKQPLEGVPVQLMRVSFDDSGHRQLKPANAAVRSDDRGEYRIYFVTPGRYYVSAGTLLQYGALNGEIPDTYSTMHYPGVADPQLASPVDVVPGTTRSGIDFSLSKAAKVRVRGRLIDAATGEPPRAPSSFYLAYYGTPGVSSTIGSGKVTYNKDGTFEFREVPPGLFSLYASITASGQPIQTSAPVPMRIGQMNITVGSSDVEGLALTLFPGGSLPGRVSVEGKTDFDPKTVFASRVQYPSLGLFPLSGGDQSLVPESQEPWAEVHADGTFRIENVMPGDFSLQLADSLSPGLYIKDAHFDGMDILTQPLHFTGKETGSLEVILSPNVASLEGVVMDNNRTAMPGAQVVLAPKRFRFRTDLFLSAVTNQDGRFSLSSIAPGEYSLYAWEAIEDYRWFDADFLKADEPFSQSVQLSESSRQSVTLRLISARNP